MWRKNDDDDGGGGGGFEMKVGSKEGRREECRLGEPRAVLPLDLADCCIVVLDASTRLVVLFDC